MSDEELDRIMDSIDRFNNMEPEERDQDEYERVMKRFEELRRAGYGPQPHHIDDKE